MVEKHFAMVSEWMVNGSINQYILVHRGVNRFELVGFWLLSVPLLTDNCFNFIAPRCF